VASVYAAVKCAFGRIDYSIHCAGIGSFGATADSTVEEFDQVNSVDYRGLWLCSREALRVMREQKLDSEAYPEAQIPEARAQRGAIVNISSGLALFVQPACAAYCGAKAGVLGLTRADAIDNANERIRVNAVLPGVIATPSTITNPDVLAFMEAMPVKQTPFKRFGLPEEVADVTVFLAGTKASYVSGASWSVDGGFTAGYT
jgi:NAD(P)-dependent dehydrogenase (short-subunit alcohol dehydrogenase family)